MLTQPASISRTQSRNSARTVNIISNASNATRWDVKKIRIRRWLNKLTPRQRACVILKMRDHKQYAEIADLLSIGVHDVMDALAEGIRARAKMGK